jgi:hypothetical protein
MVEHTRIFDTMTDTKGHFVQGRWVVDPAPVSPADAGRMDARITAATNAVITAMGEMATVTRDLVTSEEGKRYIEKTMKDTTTEVQKSFDEVLARTRAEIDSTIKSIK